MGKETRMHKGNIGHYLDISSDIHEFPTEVKFDRNNVILRFLDWVNSTGFKHFANYLVQEELDEYIKLTKRKIQSVKSVYYNDNLFDDDETVSYFRAMTSELFNDQLKDLNIHVEVVATRFTDWHNDVRFSNDKGQLHGILLWFYETHGNVLECGNAEPTRIKTNKIYYMNDELMHRLIPSEGRKKPPAKMVVMKFSKPKSD